jgi:type IV pilus assembly protein PilB
MGVGEILHKKGLISWDQLKAIQEEQKQPGFSPHQTIIDKGILEEDVLLKTLAGHLNIPFISLEDREIDSELASLVDLDLAKKHLFVPLAVKGGEMVVAVSDPMDQSAVDDLKFVTGRRIKVVLATREDIRRAMDRLYLGDEAELMESAEELSPETNVEVIHKEEEQERDVIELLQKADLPPIVRMSNAIIADAESVGASDIHIEPMEKETTVRYRVDGVMRHIMNLPKSLHLSLVSRIKVISKMDIAVKMKPQDGRVYVRVGDKTVDIRVSTLPTFHGEKVVMRLLSSEVASLGLEALGLAPEALETYREAISNPQGMILVTGPTGSGKTTTLYTSLSYLNTGENNIVTVEDPIEYQLPGINQVQVREQAGLTFAAGLRSILRQDPNIVMVGEIRDQETATIAVQAAQTGHLVLSTLHTLDSVSTILRLMDLGVDPFMVGAALKCVVAQRLCRKLCEECLEPTNPDPALLARVEPFMESSESPTFYTGKGCERCGKTGYKGRIPVFEVLQISSEVRNLINQSATEEKMLAEAHKEGMKTMFEDGLQKALAGHTSLEELFRNVTVPSIPTKTLKREAKPFDPGATQTLKGAVFPQRLADDIVPVISSPPKEADVFVDEEQRLPTILVVDDNKTNLLLLKKMLESQGYAVLEAYNGQEALEQIAGESPPDLVISDLHMPTMDGFGLLRGLKSNPQTAQIPVILLTAEMRETIEMTSLEMGADDYISKPVKKGVLLARVKRLLARTMRKGRRRPVEEAPLFVE